MKVTSTYHIGKIDLPADKGQFSPKNSLFGTGNSNIFRSLGVMVLFFLMQSGNLQAQVANYTFAASAGTYTAISGGTVAHASGWDDAVVTAAPIGFSFSFNGVAYTTCSISTNGFITFGATAPSTSLYTPISDVTSYAGAIAAWGRDLQAQATAPLGVVQYTSSGGVFTVQWSDARRYNSTTANAERFDVQIKLFQTTNVIQIVYGTWSDAVNAFAANNGQVGLRGATSTDFKNLNIPSGGSWAAPAAGVANTDICFYNESNVATKPASGQTYTFTAPPPCVTPTNQPTALVLTPGAGSIMGSFTAAASAPSHYLVVRTSTNVAPTAPVDGTIYVPGTSALGGVIVSTNTTTTFTATGLTPTTTYFFWVYSYNNACLSTPPPPLYQTASPLTASATTTVCTLSGTKSVGPTGTYLTLTAAIADLATNGLSGPVILELQSTYLSSAEPAFPVVIPQLPCISAINNLIIRPQTGATALSITSASATGTLNFDGGDFVTIDGRAGGVGASQLTISNTATTGYAIQLINSATFNTLKFCTVTGVNTGTASGVIFFNNAVGFTTGNSNNIIDNCDIHDGATTPTNLIFASGSTTDYASQNTNNTVSNSNLHDWFNATSTVASAAINIVGGASDWTITANSFYQTATRTFTMTTATEEGAILITSATLGTNFTISNNFIGGTAPLAGGTAWTYTSSATGLPIAKMIRLTATLGTASNITGNTLTNFNLTSATVNNLSGLISHVSGNVNITNNTLGSQTATGAVTFTLTNTTAGVFFLPIGFGLGAAPCTMNIANNNIGGITVNNSSTGSVSFRVIYGQPPIGSLTTINNNLVGGTVANSIQQLSNNICHGILFLGASNDGVFTNNTVRNLTQNNAGVTGSVTGVNIQTTGGRSTITGNNVSNLTTNGTNIATNNAASVVGLTMTGDLVGGNLVSNNTVSNLTNTNTTVAGFINGMTFTAPALPQPTTTVSKNTINSINLASATAGMSGVFSLSTGPFLLFNNMIRLGIDASGAPITNSLQINGIIKGNTGNVGTYHNTVYIGGTGVVSGAVNTFAYRRTSSGTLDTVMNNIFYNARSNASGTGKHFAVSLNASSAIFENFNDLLADGTGGVLGQLVAADLTPLSAWQAGTNLDWNSFSSDPKLVNPTGTSATVDLHIQAASATPVEGGGYNLSQVPVDFDMQARSGLTPVDIGADAGNFLLLDLSAPAIYYTPIIASSCNTADQVLNGVNITDATGIPLTGTLRPRIYYRKGAGAYFSQPGTFVSGTATNSFWNFTIVAADLGGLVATDVVSYYVIAQDIVVPPNVGSNPAGVIATDVNTVTTPPTTPNTYTVGAGASLSGTYTVGTGGAYPTLAAAVTAYNTACLNGPVVFSLTDATYAETAPITINANPYASAVNTLTIKPTLAGTAITGTSTTAVLVLNGADYVTVDGSIGATANTVCPASAASRDLTITNASTGTASAVIWLQTVTAGLNAATNNTIRNINLVGSGNTQTLIGVGAGSSTISITSLGTLNNNNAYVNNNISKTQYGIYSQGNSLGAKNTGTVINQNLINTVAPNNTGKGGIVVGFENNISIAGNNISEISFNSSPDVYGIALGGVFNLLTTATFSGNEVTNASVTRNIIGSVRNTSNSFSACGIFVSSALSGTNLIANNTISGVSANPTPGDFTVGLMLGGGNGSVTQVYYNTITMTSVNPLTLGTSPSFALAIAGSNPVVDLRNNIFVNTQNNGTGNNYAVAYGYTPFTNLTSNHNDYFVSPGTTYFIGATASLATPVNQATLANLQAATGKDDAAQNVAPVFVSATDLHLLATANHCLDGTGTPVSVTTDIDCAVRNASTPDIGADEFTGPTVGITIAETSGTTPNDGIICAGASVTLTATGGGTYAWSTGATTAAITVTPMTTTVYTVTITNGCVDIISVNITVNPAATAAITVAETSGVANNDGIICAGASATLTASGGGTYAWSTGAVTAAITVTPMATTTYTVTVTTAGGCSATATQTITVNPSPMAFTVTGGGSYCSAGADGPQVGLSGSQTGVNYQLQVNGVNTGAPVPGTGNALNFGEQNAPGVYTVIATATPGGCTAVMTGSVTVSIEPVPMSFMVTGGGSFCAGGAGVPVGLSGSQLNVTYTLLLNGNFVTDAQGTGNAISFGNQTAPGTYTVNAVTNTNNECENEMTGSAVITVLASPVLTETQVEPTACTSADGSINLTVGGASPGPFSYNWTTPNGSGLVNGQEDQTGLTVGSYFVTVSSTNGCSATLQINLIGPGNCDVCPVIGSLSSNDEGVCLGTVVALTASGLVNMGNTYGIQFVYFAAPTATPYTGGTVIATVPNGSLTNGGTMAQTTTSLTPAGTYYIYAILNPSPLSPTCRPSATVTQVIVPIPTANPVANQTVCNGSMTTAINFTGTPAGVTFSWTNNTPGIGLAASGTGNIAAFTATNNGTTAVTATIVVTPSYSDGPTETTCPGPSQTFTITVNPTPNVVATPSSQTICSGSAITTIALTGNVANTTFNWTRDNTVGVTGIAASGTGNIAGSLTNTTNAPITVTFTVTTTANNCPGSTTTATVIVNPTPNVVATPASQTICSGATITTIVLSGNVANTTFNWTRDNTVGVTGIAASGTGNIAGTLTNTTNAPITVTFTITTTANNCPGSTTTATVIVNPTPNVVATPSTQTICSGAAITTIVLSGNVANTTYSWSRNNTATVTGIAASGTGNIAGTLTNTTQAPITVTFTVTTTANSCPGGSTTATVIVNPSPTAFTVTGGGTICTTDNTGANVGLSGSQVGVNYQLQRNTVNTGAPVAGTGNAISFGSQGAGTYTVVATSVSGGCTANMTGSVTVGTVNCTITISDPCVCLNNATTLTNGQFGEQIKINAPGTQIWTVTAINGLYSPASPAPPAAPLPIGVGTVLTNIGGNMFTLDGRHIDAIGYTITVSNGAGTSLSIGNSCQYPNPVITAPLNNDFCLFSAPIPLTGNPGDANIVSATFTVNGVPATQFNPSMGVGQYLVTYTVNGGTPKAFGPNDPGCIQSVSTFVSVVATPSQLVCNDLVNISLDVDCVTEILPDFILEGTYGCFDDYVVELDKTAPFGNGPWVPGVVNASDIGKVYQVRVRHLGSNNKCWGSVKIEDKLPPVLTCPPFTVPCNANIAPGQPGVVLPNSLVFGSACLQPSGAFCFSVPAGCGDAKVDCDNVTLCYIDSEVLGNCASGISKTVSRKWTATDASGNSSTCVQIITFLVPTFADLTLPPDYDGIDAPFFLCTANAYPTPQWIEGQGLQGFPYVFGLPVGCTINWGYDDLVIDVCDGTYKIRRQWTIIDWCLGTSFEFNQIIKVVDDQGPQIECPADLTVSTDPFACCSTTNLPDVIITDNCSRINNISGMIVEISPFTGDTIGMVPIGGQLTTYPGNNLWIPDTLGAFGYTPCLPIGTHTVTYVAEDDCGNTSFCTFRITVRDYVPPVASCDETTTVAIGIDDPFDCYLPSADGCIGAGVTLVPASVFNDGSYDNCNDVLFTVQRMGDPYSDCILALNTVNGHPDCDDIFPDFPSEFERAISEDDTIKFYCCEVGTTQTVILRVYQVDVDGNISVGPDGSPIFNSCMVQVEVQDKIKPVCQSPANVTVTCTNFDPSLWTYGKPSIYDNCCLDTSKVYQGQCGLTHSVSYTNFDTVCNRGTIVRTFRAFDCHGFSTSCTQRVVVNYVQDYFVKFPSDVIVTVCDGTGIYGEPTFLNKDCELLGVSKEDVIFTVVPDACYKIERTWTVINWCTYNPNAGCVDVPNPNPNPTVNNPANLPGPTISALGTLPPWNPLVIKIDPADPLATNYSVFYTGGQYKTTVNGVLTTFTVPPVSQVNCYRYKQIIKVIDTKAPIIANCPASPTNFCDVTPNDPLLWNESYYYDQVTGSHDLCEGPTDLTITATDACSLSAIDIHYLLFLDLNGDGTMETVINSNNLPGANTVFFGNALNQNFTGGTPYNFDERPVLGSQKYRFAIQTTTSGVNKTAHVAWNTTQSPNTYVVPELPYGTHKIKWFVADGCGNEAVCEYTFIVKDCKAPTVVCLNGLSVNIMPTQMIQLWATDFLQYAEDNCTPVAQLKYGIRRSGTGSGFPVDGNGNPITNVVFTCADLGQQPVELWAIDAAGNADYCETYVIVQDNNGNCHNTNGPNATVAGAIQTESGSGLEEASLELSVVNSPIGSFTNLQMSASNGNYEFTDAVPMGSDMTVTPVKDNNPLNGVSTYDLVLISRHILGLEPLGSPYKMIAADANKSGSITTFDIVELRKLILGIYQELPNNTSWRFVDKAFVFPNPNNPFQTLFPENISSANMQADEMHDDFVAVKIGDVNQNAIANAQQGTEDRTSGTLLIDVDDRQVKAGETFDVNFKTAEAAQGFQFTLNLNGLAVTEIAGGDKVDASNFGVFSDALTASVDGAREFTVKFRATKAGKLSELLNVSSRITKAEAYTMTGDRQEVALRFQSGGTSTIAGVGFELYQNQPNPFVGTTFIGFHLPEAAAATLTVYDESGRVIFTQKGDFAKGYNSIAVERALLNTSGMLYYKLETATDMATKKMIQTK